MAFSEKVLEKVLIDKGLLGKEQLEEVLRLQRGEGASIGKLLVEKGLISEDALLSCLAEELNLPPVDLSKFTIDPELVELIPEHVARHYLLIPVAKFSNILTVAMADPLNVFALDDLRMTTGYTIQPVLASEDAIRQAIEEYYGKEREFKEFLKDIAEEESFELLKEEEEESIELEKAENRPAIKLVNEILREGVAKRASDILIEPEERSLRVRYRIDGLLREGPSPPKKFQSAIVSRIKILAKLDIAERRIPQDGRFRMKIDGREVDFRVSTVPSLFGEKIALRLLDKGKMNLDLDSIGLDEDVAERLKECASKPYGMILLCGPTGSGKTTTLYSILNFVDDPGKNLITVEDPVEYEIPGINQVAVRHEVGLTFASALRAILRQDPDVIMVGEIRDFETADVAVKAALTGHLVLSTLHTTDAPSTIARLQNMGIEPFLVASSLIAAGAQRLVRKLCPKCKEEYKPPEEVLARLGLEESSEMTFYRPRGCAACDWTGYAGRVPVLELLVVSQRIREMITAEKPISEIKEVAREEGMLTLREAALRKAVQGVTSIEEVIRVTAE